MRETRTSGLMSGDGKRSDWQCLKPPRPSSTLPTGRKSPRRTTRRGRQAIRCRYVEETAVIGTIACLGVRFRKMQAPIVFMNMHNRNCSVRRPGHSVGFQAGPDMSKPSDSDRAPAARPTVRAGRLHERFKIASRMKPYANRLRLRLTDLDLTDPYSKLRLETACDEMSDILINKKICKDVAHRAVAEALDIAADHQLEALRRNQDLQDLSRSERDLKLLLKQLDRLAQAISRVPPLAKGKLNKIIAVQDWNNFDTEIFTELVHAMMDALSMLSPASITKAARWVMNESARGSKDPAVAQIARTAPPAIVELWETIPAGTRIQVEAGLRNWVPPTRRPAMEFLKHLVVLLDKFQPRLKRGRRPPIERHLGRRLAKIWRGLGLHVGRAYDGVDSCHVESNFQRFVRLALTAVGDNSQLSSRQIMNLKSELQRKLRSPC
jgi:hypothetical protein